MNSPARRIAVVEGASGAAVQELFSDLVGRLPPSLRVAGMVAEEHGLPDRACRAGYLRRIPGGQRFAIFEDRGAGAAGCHLDGDGVLAAADAARRDIAAGCDLVVLSKFGKLEAAGKGLLGAFAAALAAHVPILTSISPTAATAWERFAGPGFTALPAEPAAIASWVHSTVMPALGAGTHHLGSPDRVVGGRAKPGHDE